MAGTHTCGAKVSKSRDGRRRCPNCGYKRLWLRRIDNGPNRTPGYDIVILDPAGRIVSERTAP